MGGVAERGGTSPPQLWGEYRLDDLCHAKRNSVTLSNGFTTLIPECVHFFTTEESLALLSSLAGPCDCVERRPPPLLCRSASSGSPGTLPRDQCA